ncbi:hypothetical protein C0J52_23099 [Blattella germanica]|nr:hypothetical protein C0J52_23099 [Blattella germanica]
MADSKNGYQLIDIKHEEDHLPDRKEETTFPIMKEEFCEEGSCVIPDAHQNYDIPETKCFVTHLDQIEVKSEVESTRDVSESMKPQLKYDEKNLILQDKNRDSQVDDDSSLENNCKYDFGYNLKPKIMLYTNTLTGEFTYFCNTCNKSFSHSFSPNMHNCIENEEPLYVCSICNISYVRNESILAHIVIHIQTSNLFTDHTLTGPRKKEINRKEHICHVCNKIFQESSVYKRHLRFHSSNRPYACNVCAKTFIEEDDLKKHSEIHMGIRPYSCDMCSKSFRKKNDLIVHKRRHTGVRPYLCEFCGKTFYKQGDLVSHLRIHKGDRPYTCDICNKAFRIKPGLVDHMIIHSDSRPYTCEVCNKSFSRIDNMRIHKLLHQKDQPHVCTVCKKGFSQLRTLKKHMRIH